MFIMFVRQNSASMLMHGYRSLDSVRASFTNSIELVLMMRSYAPGTEWIYVIICESSLKVFVTKNIFFSMFMTITFWANFITRLMASAMLSSLKKCFSYFRLKKISQTMILREKLRT